MPFVLAGLSWSFACGETASGPPDAGRLPVDVGPPDLGVALDVGPPPTTDVEPCRLAFNGGSAVGVGFPRPDPRLRTTGTVRAAVLFVRFSDVAPDRSPEDVFRVLSPGAEDFFSSVSYGQMNLVLEPHLVWLPLTRPASHYGAGIRTFAGHRAFLAEAVALADPDFDFATTDVVVVMSTPNASDVPYGPTWMGIPGFELRADGNLITNGVTSGADLIGWGALWLNHELGHSMSLPDLYSFDEPRGFTRPFGVMDLISSEAPELLAWERWQLDWLQDDQVVCNPDPGTAIRLAPIETRGGTKAVVVRRGTSKVVVAESRRASGFDRRLTRGGVVVSVVNAALATGKGPIRVVNGQRALRPGQQVSTEGVTIEVLELTELGDVIRVVSD